MRTLFALLLFSCSLPAQVNGIKIIMSPGDGIAFLVDGETFYGSRTFLWPQGSKHTVTVQGISFGNHPKTEYVFQNWTINAPVPQNWTPTTLVITADPSISSVVASFATYYEFDLNYFNCPSDGTPCLSPGTVYNLPGPCINPAVQNTSCFIAAGSSINVLVQPSIGYIFTGWLSSPASGNKSQGFATTFSLNAPLSISPQFHLSRPVNIQVSTTPGGLKVLADNTPITSPASLEWGTQTTHALSVASPQIDGVGGAWLFSSWSDGGAQNHNFVVQDGYNTLSLGALFVPAYKISLLTEPPGLSLVVNAKTISQNLNFLGAAGTLYQLAAPASQIDGQGRINQFVSWSNGGAQTQTYIQPTNDDRLTAKYQVLGHLTLISSPPGLSFVVNGKSCMSPCGFDQLPGTPMNISVPASIPLSAASRLDFQGWQDSAATSRTFLMTSSLQTLSVSYQTMYMVTTATSPATGGSVFLDPIYADGFYPANTQLQATISQNPGFQFKTWQGDLAGSQSLASFTVSSPKAITAVFNPVPFLPPAAVQNSAGQTPVPGVAPGSIVSIFGLNLASATQAGPANPLSQTLLNITVTVGQQILPLYSVSPEQVNVQLPFETPLGNGLLQLHQTGEADVNAVFTVVRNAPGIFGVTHSDRSVVDVNNPASAGETLTITGTGFGPYDRNPPTGIAIPTDSTFTLLDPVTVNAGGISMSALTSGPSFSKAGMNLATFQVPASLPSGTSVPLNLTINGAESNQILLFLQ
jgi:uncharacterized protein (TIGR03437 family)